MDADEIKSVILRGFEARSVEMKQSLDISKKPVKAKIAKGCMALANTRDGGLFLIGMKKTSTDYHEPAGVSPDDLVGYEQDRVASVVMEYGEPFVELEVSLLKYDDHPLLEGKTFVAISVAEFAELPVICKRSHPDEGLREGGIYIRSLERYESRLVKTEAEMRHLIDLATEKRLRGLLETTRRAGGVIVPEDLLPAEASQFESEAQDFQGD